jgi:branched-chain amino acid transport system substrate-binding protein
MKLTRVLVAFSILALVMVATVGAAAPKTYKIAHLSPLTGSASSYGYYMVNAAKMAVEEINAKGGVNGVPLEYMEIDETSNSAQAIDAAYKAVAWDPLVILGPNRSGGVLAAEFVWKEAKIPTITDGTSAETTRKGNPYTFRMQISSEFWIPLLVRTAVEVYKSKKIAVMYGLNDYSKANWVATEPAMKKYGITPVTVQTFNDGDQDFTAQLLKVKASGADALFVYSYTPEVGMILKQRAELGMPNLLVFSERAASVPSVEDLSGTKNYEGLVCTTTLSPGDPRPGVQKFIKDYEAKYKHIVSSTHINHYDSVYIVADILKRVGPDREKIRQELAKLDYVGVLGHYVADKEGNFVHTMYTQVRENGKWKLLLTEEYPVVR